MTANFGIRDAGIRDAGIANIYDKSFPPGTCGQVHGLQLVILLPPVMRLSLTCYEYHNPRNSCHRYCAVISAIVVAPRMGLAMHVAIVTC